MRNALETVRTWQIIVISILVMTGVFLIAGNSSLSINGEPVGGNALEDTQWYGGENQTYLSIGKEGEKYGLSLTMWEGDNVEEIKGKYTLLQGKDAKSYIAQELPELGMTEQEVNDLHADPYIFLFTDRVSVNNGRETLLDDTTVPIIAFLDGDVLTVIPNKSAPTHIYTYTPATEAQKPKAGAGAAGEPSPEKPEEETAAEATDNNQANKGSPSGSGAYAIGDLKLSPPEGYKLSSNFEDNVSFFNDDFQGVFVYTTTEDVIETLPDIYPDGEEKTIGAYSGYFYKQDDKTYGFGFVHQGKGYKVSADDPQALEELLK